MPIRCTERVGYLSPQVLVPRGPAPRSVQKLTFGYRAGRHLTRARV